MAHDKTPERNNLIFFYTLLSVITLVILEVFFFGDYFRIETEGWVAQEVLRVPPSEAIQLKTAQREQLEQGPMPIERAKEQLAQRGRQAFPVIEARPGDDRNAVEGWTFARGTKKIAPVFAPERPEGAGEVPSGATGSTGLPAGSDDPTAQPRAEDASAE